jgi:hypothetical protein
MVQRKIAVAIVVVLLATACSGGGTSPSRELTLRRPLNGTRVVPSPTTTAVPTSLLSAIGESAGSGSKLPLIVAGIDGVFEVHVLGGRRLLMGGTVEFAIDDARGGLLFQIHRGRPNPTDDAEHDSTIWWVKAGEAMAQMLLLSTGESGGELSLHDAYESDGLHVIYSRHEDSAPSADGTVRDIDWLRSFDVGRGESTDLVIGEGPDVGLDNVSCNADVIAFTRHDADVTECRFIDLSGSDVTIPAAARPPCSGDCSRACMLGWDGSLLMLLADSHQQTAAAARTERLDLVDTTSATVLDSLVLPAAADRVAAFDLRGPWLVVSTGLDEKALVFDLRMLWAGPFELPVRGVARFVRAPLDVGKPISF